MCVAWSAFLALYSNGSTTQLVSNLGLMAVALGAGIQALARGRREVGHTARAWGLLGLSCLSWGCGQAAWTWYESVLGREVPFPSIADIGYLLFVPLAAAALLAFPSVPRRLSSRIRTVLDGLLIACALLFMSWMLVLGPLFDAGGDRLTLTIGLAYPLGDVVIITILLFASSHRSQQASSSGASRPLLFAGLLAFAIADSCFVYLTNSGAYSSGSLIDIGWFCAFAAIFLAGTVRASTEAEPQSTDDEVPDRFAVLVPYVPVVLVVLLGAIRLALGGRLGSFLGWNLLALLMLAVIRQVAALMENLSLTTHLELRVQERTAELDRSEQRFRSLVQNSSDVITVVDGSGTITYQSPSIGRVLGHESSALLDTSYFDLVHLDDHADLAALIDSATLREGTNIAAELRMLSGDGVWCHVEVLGTSLLDDAHVAGIVLNARDVTERKELENQLAHQAFHDPLTNLANRALFADRLDHALKQAARRRRPLAVLYFDLDGFKGINDTLGHVAGDLVLQEVAARLVDLRTHRGHDQPVGWGRVRHPARRAGDRRRGERRRRAAHRRVARPFLGGLDRGVHQRQHRHRGVRSRHRGVRRPASLRRPGDVPGEGEPPGFVLQVRAGHAGRRQGACRARPRSSPGARARRVVRCVPAHRRTGHRADRRRRSAGALDTPDPRPGSASGVHPGCRGQWLDRRPRQSSFFARPARTLRPGARSARTSRSA